MRQRSNNAPWWVGAGGLALTLARIALKLVILFFGFIVAFIYGLTHHGKQ